MAFDSTTSLSLSDPAAAAAPDLYMSSDTDIVSSGSNSGASDPPRRVISVSARFCQKTNSRLRRILEPRLPLLLSSRRSFSDSPMSPRLPGRSPSPCRESRGGDSPSRGRSWEASPNGHMVQALANAPSIINFAAEWRCINAQTDATLLVQSFTAEGLIVASREETLQSFKKRYAHEHEPVKDLLGAVKAIRPTALIGSAGVGQSFTKEVIEAMSSINELYDQVTGDVICHGEKTSYKMGARAILVAIRGVGKALSISS
ncbi:NADP-dependent malic enzyme 1 [Zea mays]|uniref:NADP-dependent malic enzyme 1 n=1 Tax=Zea mays TaxID=4577 RepID=A0A1D6N3E9_MAIZE|nr:NADP-dependent malic enzyme 1 [Zea mays]